MADFICCLITQLFPLPGGVNAARVVGGCLCCGRVAARRPFQAVWFELFSTGGTSFSRA